MWRIGVWEDVPIEPALSLSIPAPRRERIPDRTGSYQQPWDIKKTAISTV